MNSPLYNRIYKEYFMSDRIGYLDNVVTFLKSHGYVFLNLRQFAEKVRNGLPIPNKCAIMRIDVDSDPKYCINIARVLENNRCDASFYFRLSTIDRAVMRQLLDEGFEVGYHYEELATLAKKEHLRTPDEVMERIEECRAQFRRNFACFTSELGAHSVTVASHGDFANRKLRLGNTVVVDEAVRKDLGIVAEAYDDDLVGAMDHSIIDRGPEGWEPDTPERLATNALDRPHCMRILIHPKSWRRNFYWNTRQNIGRVIEALHY